MGWLLLLVVYGSAIYFIYSSNKHFDAVRKRDRDRSELQQLEIESLYEKFYDE